MADKALLSGINNYKSIGDLRGCLNDVDSIRKLLLDEFQFEEKNIRPLKDEKVTKAELTKGWNWLLKDAKPGDRLIFHFSGHGSFTVDENGDEPDRQDELLCLVGMDWKDPKTYLLDDELREWTKQIPDGVAVTFLLDCCHSGTGTRFIEPLMVRAAEFDYRSTGSLSLDKVARQRLEASAKSRSMDERSIDRAGIRPDKAPQINQNTVLARFAPPPPEVQVAIDAATKKSSFRDILRETRTRSGADDSMNHVLWAGCRDNQTSADAFINGDYHGAFTYHFCRAVREAGSNARSQMIVRKLRDSLSSDRFDQVPQLEPDGTDGTIFGAQSPTSSPESNPHTAKPAGESVVPTPEQWQSLLTSLQQIAAHLSSADAVRSESTGRSGIRSLVWVHGICKHDVGYSNEWWNSLSPHLSAGLRQTLDNNRHEVLWSQHVTRTDRAAEEAVSASEQRQMELMLEEILQERVAKEAGEMLVDQSQLTEGSRAEEGAEVRGMTQAGQLPRAMFGIPGLNCIDDFVKYLTIDSVRRAVLAEFTNKVRPLLERGDTIDVVSHSWGTVVAFEALRSLDRMPFRGRVNTWFTVGAALAISFIARRLRPGDGQKPALVDHWINLNARGDAVGGSLQANGMQVDREYLRLVPAECEARFGLVTPACAHSSYFKASNHAVNREIFARWIERR